VAEERRAGATRPRSAEIDMYGLDEARDALQIALSKYARIPRDV
jgi:hypothetical protein